MEERIEDYIVGKIEEYKNNNKVAYLEAICDDVKSNYSTDCKYEYIGGFESPGYDIDCYAISFIDEDGEIVIVPYTNESY
ncbi:hypothetical protein [Paenibacillus sp. USHLN196]|uniref:hypothetical protein n=1 Tax=Paenibacillus sp. USHLN196 TaxID=3081291 RepID=UPI00301AEE92